MEYNIKKINQIGKMLAEIIEETVEQTKAKSVRIYDIEMALRENLLAIEQSALKQFFWRMPIENWEQKSNAPVAAN